MSAFDHVNFHEVVKADAFFEPAAADVIRDVARVPLLESGIFFSPFSKSSAQHGRTMEDPYHKVFAGGTLTDENDDIYTSFTIKGANCAQPYANYYQIEPSSVRVNGMLDASTFERCRAASELLRGQGVLTEWPILHMRPKSFPDGEKDIPLNAFRKMIYDNYIDTVTTAHNMGISTEQFNYHRRPGQSFVGSQHVPNFGIVGAVGEALSEMQFSVMYRAGLSPIRLWELTEHAETGALTMYIRNAIIALQARKPKHFDCWPEIESLDTKSEDDQQKYLEEVLPKIMGENLARFHNANCYHKYLHGGNWTLAGEIVDLDSVRCDEFDKDKDEPRDYTIIDKLSEAFQAYDHIVRMASIVYLMEDDKGRLSREYTMPVDKMWAAFKSSYFCERYQAQDLTTLEKITLTSHLSSLPDNIEDWEEPEIVPLPHPDVTDLFNREEIKNKIDDADAFAAACFDKLSPIVDQHLIKLVEAEGIDGFPDWFKAEKLRHEEVARLIGKGYRELVASATAV